MGPPFFVPERQQTERTLHEDTLKLITLWEAETVRDQLLVDIASLQEAIDAANVALAKSQKDIEAVEQELRLLLDVLQVGLPRSKTLCPRHSALVG